LAYAIHLLASRPDIQEKARKEVLQVLGNKECTYEACQKMDYLSNVIKESMRLFPPVNGIPRKTSKDTVLGGYSIPKDTVISVSIYSIHHVCFIF
jgi:cytochrome P450